MSALPPTPWDYLDIGEVVDSEGETVAEVYFADDQEKTDAIGYLVAAAPQLLATLRLARVHVAAAAATCTNTPAILLSIDAVIAKATQS